jgi:anti-sigma factor RsiW
MLFPRHRRLRFRVEAYLDGELDERTAAEIADHVRACWFCSGDLATLRLVRSALRRRAGHPTPLSLLRVRRFARQLDR